MTTATILLQNPAQAHAALEQLWRQTIKPHAQAGGAAVLEWTTTDAYHRHGLRKHFHGHVLNAIAEQAVEWSPTQRAKVRWHPEAWKNAFRMYVPPTFEEVTKAGRLLVRERRRSTEELSDDEFALFSQKVQAVAVTDYGVNFDGEL